jgi:hypothetical protein
VNNDEGKGGWKYDISETQHLVGYLLVFIG